MSIKWGSWVSIGGGVKAQAGLDLSWSAPGGSLDPSDTTVTVTRKRYLKIDVGAANGGADPWTLTGGGNASGTQSWSLSGSGDSTLLGQDTVTVAISQSKTSTLSVTFKINDLAGSTADATVTADLTIPRRPVNAPAALSGLGVARVSDTQQTLSWTGAPTSTAPYESQRVRRWDNVSGVWSVIKSDLSGTARSYSDPTTRPDREYRYAVEAVNNAGSSGWHYGTGGSNGVFTTPSAPGKPSATKTVTGAIRVTRGALSDAAEAWQVWHAADGVWDASPLASVDDADTSWLWPSPDPSTVHTFALKATVTKPALTSTSSPTSDPVQLITPPSAPRIVAPAAGSAHDAAEPLTVAFEHVQVDTTPMTASEMEHRLSGSTGAWAATGGKVAGTEGVRTVAGGTFVNGTSVDVRVRTWGEHPDPGSWATTQVKLSQRPTVNITSPATSVPWSSPMVTVEWDFYDPEGSAQSGWSVELLDEAGTEVLDEASGYGATRKVQMGVPLADAGSYQVRVVARDGVGLSSLPQTLPFPVAYALPPAASLDPSWDDQTGTITLQWDTPDAATGGVQALSVRIDRADGFGWVTVSDGLPLAGVVVDMVPPTGTVVTYRAVTISALPSSNLSASVTVATPTRFLFLNYGPGFGQVVRLWADLTASRSFSREKEVKRPAGASFGVGFSGEARTRTYNLSTKLFDPARRPDPSSTWEDLEALADAEDPVCLRDPEGVRMFVQVGGVDLSDHLRHPHRPLQIPMTQTDWTEQVVSS